MKQPLYELLTTKSGSYDQTFVDQTKEIESDCGQLLECRRGQIIVANKP